MEEFVDALKATRPEQSSIFRVPRHPADTVSYQPHPETQSFKMAIHGWGYTRRPKQGKQTTIESNVSSPPQRSDDRPDFVPADAEERLRKGLREMLPELPDRPFEKACLCWYTDTPTGDFIMDYHADFSNLLIAGGGSGQ